MSPVGDITIYESQLFRAYSAPTAAVRDFHSKTLRNFTLQPKKEPHELHLHRPVRRRYSLHRMDKLSGKAPESPQQRQKRSQIHQNQTSGNPCLLRRLRHQRRSHEPGICNQTINPGQKISSDGILKEVTVPSKYKKLLKNLSKIFYLTISSNRHIRHKTIHHNKMTRASQHNKYVENLM